MTLIYHKYPSVPIDYHIDYVEGVVEVRASGKLSGPEILERLEAIFTDRSWQYHMPQIWGGTQLAELDVDFPDLKAIHSLILRLLYPSRPD